MKQRNEIAVEDTWDLTKVYESDTAWYQALEEVKKELPNYATYQHTMMDSAEKLYELLKFDQTLSRKLEKLYVYASQMNDTDTSDNTYIKMVGEITSLYTETMKATSYIVPTLMKYSYDTIDAFINSCPKLAEFEHSLKDIYRYKKHTLDEKKEVLLASYSGVLSKISETYHTFTNSDMTIGTMKDEDGNEVELTENNYHPFIRSKDRRVRKDAFTLLHNAYGKYKNTLATTFTGMLDLSKTNASVHHYDSAIDMYLYSDDMNPKVYQNLIDVVSENMKSLFRYYDLKKKVLGLDEVHIYDIYIDLTEKSNRKYSFEKGKQMVLDALSVLGEEYTSKLKEAFDNRWIDIYPNKGKRSGAYSGGGYDTNPYILLNYNDTLNDVSTLAHELGHSIHSAYTRENNGYETGHYSIFVAEIASTVNELLLSKYLLTHTEDKEEKREILSGMLDLFKSTIYRQTMFAEFEQKVHDEVRKGHTLTAAELCEIYYEINKKYFGTSVLLDSEIQYEWARIPHFYTPFYVYKYATGLSCACKIVTDILSGKENAKQNYIEFLKHGSKDYPKEHLKMVGIDIEDREYIESAIHMFDETIKEMTELLEEN